MIALLLAGCIPADVPFDGVEYTPDTGWEDELPAGCVPDEHLAVGRHELSFSTDVVARYQASATAPDPDSWDYVGVGHTEVSSGSEPLDEHWFGARFSTATHTASLDVNDQNWGVYREDETGLYLVGVASGQPDYTALSYEPAVRMWSWPLQAGAPASTSAVATGLFEGDAYPMSLGFGNEVSLTHHYSVQGRGAGELHVDAGVFEAQQVHIALEAVGTDIWGIEYGRAETDTWLFIAPCAGMVARISGDGFMGLGL